MRTTPYGRTPEQSQPLGDAAALANLLDEFLAICLRAHGRPAAGRRPDRRDDRTDGQILRAELVGDLLESVVVDIDVDVRIEEEQVHAVEFRRRPRSLRLVSRIIVSRSIGGSESGPFPTNPGQAALWSLG